MGHTLSERPKTEEVMTAIAQLLNDTLSQLGFSFGLEAGPMATNLNAASSALTTLGMRTASAQTTQDAAKYQDAVDALKQRLDKQARLTHIRVAFIAVKNAVDELVRATNRNEATRVMDAIVGHVQTLLGTFEFTQGQCAVQLAALRETIGRYLPQP